MPEGHVIHRAARLQGRRFRGERVSATSPQGRFDVGAEQLDGQTVDTIDALGKHLFYRFDSGDVLHVHLGLFGKFRLSKLPAPEPSPNARRVLESKTDHLHLAGPTVCELIEPSAEERLVAKLGPDPILRPADGAARMVAKLSRRSIPIAAALLDQSVVCGIGNVYRSELLFQIGLHPLTPAKEVDPSLVEMLWDRTVVELVEGEKRGSIVTVDPADVGADNKKNLEGDDRLYAYHRDGEPCHRCGDIIVRADVDSRSAWWCPTCQPR
jgi:endonuclease-8